MSACDLSSALGRLFVAVAQGQLKPKTASTLAYLGQTLVHVLPLAQNEYIKAFGPDEWRETVRVSHEQSADHKSPDHNSPDADPPSPTEEPEPAPDPEAPVSTPEAGSDSSRRS